MKRIKLINRIIYFIILIGFILYLASGFIFNRVDKISVSYKGIMTQIEPETVKYIDNDTIEYYICLDDMSGDNMALKFLSRHQEVEVYAENSLIYYIKAHKSIYGTTTGTNYAVVNIPSGTTHIKVRLTNVYSGLKIRETSFEYGDEAGIVTNLVSDSLIPVILSSFIILFGIGMFLLWFICRKKNANMQSLLYFGIFAINIGMWTLNETALAIFLVEDRKIASLIGYILLMLLPVPFMQAEKNFFRIENSMVNNIFGIIFTITDIILLVCHMTGIWEFKKSVYIIHIMLILSFLYFCGILIKRIKDKGFDRKVRLNIVAVAALGISMVLDIEAYYKGMQQTDVYGKIGIIVFIAMLGYEIISEAFEQIREGQKAEFYKEMAITDSMTGLYNRTAFEQWEHDTSDYTGFSIVTFDLNNLKWCNDNLGHAAGDEYIELAGKVIKDIFGRHGSCYRIGGDEFCTVIRQKERRFNLERHVRQLREREKKIKRENKHMGYDFNIACGYAEFDGRLDSDFEDTRSRADKNMYDSKKMLKCRLLS